MGYILWHHFILISRFFTLIDENTSKRHKKSHVFFHVHYFVLSHFKGLVNHIKYYIYQSKNFIVSIFNSTVIVT